MVHFTEGMDRRYVLNFKNSLGAAACPVLSALEGAPMKTSLLADSRLFDD